jgi:hypothetical protein
MRRIVQIFTKKADYYAKHVDINTIREATLKGAAVIGGVGVMHYSYTAARDNIYPPSHLALEKVLETQKELHEVKASSQQNHLETQKQLGEVKGQLGEIMALLKEEKNNG